MKIYQIGGSISDYSGTNWYWHHTATKREAKQHIAELRKDVGREGVEGLDISEIEVKPTRAGIAGALNDFVAYTCINEG